MNNEFLLLKGHEIDSLLKGKEVEIMETIKSAYIVHSDGKSCLPHSSFVRFPEKEKERIIALPGYLGGSFEIAGMKWIASFPGNLERGMERASAQLTLNSTDTGYPIAFMECSIISAKRTAASAAAAADVLRGDQSVKTVGMVGCGLINHETLRFLLAARPEIEEVRIFDLSNERATQFVSKCRELSEAPTYTICESMNDTFVGCDVTALATTAVKPYITDLSMCDPTSVILHTSLRDMVPEVVLNADNMIDDFDHALRARTSLHLAEMEVGNRDFVRCEIADIFSGKQPLVADPKKLRIFSPFGLGVLDLALGQLAYNLAREQKMGSSVEGFLPAPWFQR